MQALLTHVTCKGRFQRVEGDLALDEMILGLSELRLDVSDVCL